MTEITCDVLCAYSVFGSVIFWTCGVCAWCDESQQAHTPQVQKITLPNTDYAHKTSQVISVMHVQHTLRMDHKGSETSRSF